MANELLLDETEGTLDLNTPHDLFTVDPWPQGLQHSGLHDTAVTSHHGSPMPFQNDQYFSFSPANLHATPGFTTDSDGTVQSTLTTRSNTPHSDHGFPLLSPGPLSNGLQSAGSGYRSRLPRRRSLYSRQRPSIRQPAFAPGLAEGVWTPDNTQAIDSTGTLDPAITTFNGPLRRSDSNASLGSECSNSSAYSTASASSATSAGRRSSSSHRRQRKRTAALSSKKANVDDRPFKCTFCCDAFKSKYDWRRHEKSLHLDLEVWKCAPVDGTVPCPDSSGGRCCAYCLSINPDDIHLSTHNHLACASRSNAARSFRRRDHLAQHLRVFHKLTNPPPLDSWVDHGPVVTSRCGFCDSPLASWEERADHLAAHFRQGCTMRDWKGGHGFEEAISARLTNALPPYYLATEAQSLVPFSATSAESKDHFTQVIARMGSGLQEPFSTTTGGAMPPLTEQEPHQTAPFGSLDVEDPTTATPALISSRAMTASAFADILASHLVRFALEFRQQIGVLPTDEQLQREARQALYSSDDPWNQTIADSPQWLMEFREKNGLN